MAPFPSSCSCQSTCCSMLKLRTYGILDSMTPSRQPLQLPSPQLHARGWVWLVAYSMHVTLSRQLLQRTHIHTGAQA